MITLRVPATSANIGPGFDSFGIALKLYNKFTFSVAEADEWVISPNTCVDLEGLPARIEDNMVFMAMQQFYDELGKNRPPIRVEMEAHVPLVRGLGSSSSAIVAGMAGANGLAGNPLSREDLVSLAMALEGHPDNVTPAIMGGVTMWDQSGIYQLPWPDHWKIIIAIPPYRLQTKKARAALPEAYPIQDAIFNLRKASLLTYALLRADEDAFRASLHDRLHQPYRAPLINEFGTIQTIARENGAFGAVISGAGPSVAVFHPESNKETLLNALREYRVTQMPELRLLNLEPDRQGTHEVGEDASLPIEA